MCGTRFKERCPHIAKVNNQPRSEIIGAGITRGEEKMKSPYKDEHKTNKKCFRCKEHLYEEVIEEIDYPLVCLNCDENMYNFEAVE